MPFFQLLTRRYEHASTILTSNKGFEDWGDICGDEIMAAALIDRLVHHCHIVNIRGNSNRLGLAPLHLFHFRPVVVFRFQPVLTEATRPCLVPSSSSRSTSTTNWRSSVEL